MMYDEEFDIAYIRLSDKQVAYSKVVDDYRWVDYAQDGTPVGLQLFNASERPVPFKREAIERELVGGVR
jgi:uncharacterized protein YuzE